MLISQLLTRKDIQRINSLRITARKEAEKATQPPKHSIKPKEKPKEKLSERDWKELMGCHRDTYQRRRGAVRRK